VKESGVGERPDHVVVGEGGWTERKLQLEACAFSPARHWHLPWLPSPIGEWVKVEIGSNLAGTTLKAITSLHVPHQSRARLSFMADIPDADKTSVRDGQL
jgi:hypothetical protein